MMESVLQKIELYELTNGGKIIQKLADKSQPDDIFAKPFILTLGGWNATSLGTVKGMGRSVSDLHKNQAAMDEMRVMSAMYVIDSDTPQMPADFVNSSLRLLNENPLYAEDSVVDLVQSTLSQAYLDESGEKRSLDNSLKRLQNLQFFSYSLGGALVDQIENAMHKDMQDKGFSQQEASKLIEEGPLAVKNGNVARGGGNRKTFRSLEMLNLGDILPFEQFGKFPVAFKNALKDSPEHQAGGNVSIFEEGNRTHVFFGPTGNEHLLPDKAGKFINKKGGINEFEDPSGHSPPNYLLSTLGKGGFIAPFLNTTILNNGVNGASRDTKSLFAVLEGHGHAAAEERGIHSVPYETMAEALGYRSQIEYALNNKKPLPDFNNLQDAQQAHEPTILAPQNPPDVAEKLAIILKGFQSDATLSPNIEVPTLTNAEKIIAEKVGIDIKKEEAALAKMQGKDSDTPSPEATAPEVVSHQLAKPIDRQQASGRSNV